MSRKYKTFVIPENAAFRAYETFKDVRKDQEFLDSLYERNIAHSLILTDNHKYVLVYDGVEESK